MDLALRQLTNRILRIAYSLEFDQFISKERRGKLKAELSSLIAKRNNLIKVMDEKKEDIK